MKRLSFTFFLVAFLAIVAQAQPAYVVKVLAHRGPATINGNHIESGDYVAIADKLEMKHGSYVALVHSRGKIIELEHEGSYTGATLEALALEPKKGIADNYVEFISEHLFTEEEGENLTIVGAVIRDVEDTEVHGVYLPSIEEGTMVFILPELILAWQETPHARYHVEAHDLFTRELWRVDKSDTILVLDGFRLDHMKKQPMLITVVPNDGKPSYRYPLMQLDEFEGQVDKSEAKALIRDYKKAASAAEYAILAQVLEGRGLLVDANTCWLRAVELDEDAYLPLYHGYLSRLNLE